MIASDNFSSACGASGGAQADSGQGKLLRCARGCSYIASMVIDLRFRPLPTPLPPPYPVHRLVVVPTWSSSIKERLLRVGVMGVVIICLPLEDIREGNSIDGIVRRHNQQAMAAALLLWWTGTWAFIITTV